MGFRLDPPHPVGDAQHLGQTTAPGELGRAVDAGEGDVGGGQLLLQRSLLQGRQIAVEVLADRVFEFFANHKCSLSNSFNFFRP